MRPGWRLSPTSTITNEHVADAPEFSYVEVEVLRALDVSAIIAHNAHVDVGVLQRKLGGWTCPEVFDTLKLVRRLLPGRTTYKLGALVEEFDWPTTLDGADRPHRATYDAIVTARLFRHLASQRTLEELRNRSARSGDEDEPALFY